MICSQCNKSNRPEARICGGCGAPLSASIAAAGGPQGPGPTNIQGNLGPVRAGGAVAAGGFPALAAQPQHGSGAGPQRTQISEEVSRPIAGWLVVLRSRHVPPYHDIPIFEGRNTIGRAHGRQQLDDPRVSGQHVLVNARGSQVVINDLSANGTAVNSQAVQSHPLQPGDMVKMGGTTLVYVPFPLAGEPRHG